jgi:hypothetical protein
LLHGWTDHLAERLRAVQVLGLHHLDHHGGHEGHRQAQLPGHFVVALHLQAKKWQEHKAVEPSHLEPLLLGLCLGQPASDSTITPCETAIISLEDADGSCADHGVLHCVLVDGYRKQQRLERI